jgi:hypothetical protein
MAAVQDPTQMALLAVNALFTNPDKEEKKRANEWLSEFQHTVSTQLYMPSSACKKKRRDCDIMSVVASGVGGQSELMPCISTSSRTLQPFRLCLNP